MPRAAALSPPAAAALPHRVEDSQRSMGEGASVGPYVKVLTKRGQHSRRAAAHRVEQLGEGGAAEQHVVVDVSDPLVRSTREEEFRVEEWEQRFGVARDLVRKALSEVALSQRPRVPVLREVDAHVSAQPLHDVLERDVGGAPHIGRQRQHVRRPENSGGGQRGRRQAAQAAAGTRAAAARTRRAAAEAKARQGDRRWSEGEERERSERERANRSRGGELALEEVTGDR